jgi:hypothetical protein
MLRFDPDGTFAKVGVLLQQRPSGMFSFTVELAGTVTASDDRLVLTPTEGTHTLQDPDSPSSNYSRPAPLVAESFMWDLDDVAGEPRLAMVDSVGSTITYRQDG